MNVLNYLGMEYNYLDFIRCSKLKKKNVLSETINKLTNLRGHHMDWLNTFRIMCEMKTVRIYKCYCVVFRYLHALHRFAGGPSNKLFKSLNNLLFSFFLSFIYFVFLTQHKPVVKSELAREIAVYIQFNVHYFNGQSGWFTRFHCKISYFTLYWFPLWSSVWCSTICNMFFLSFIPTGNYATF